MITATVLLIFALLLPSLFNANPAPEPETAPLFGFGNGRTQSAGAEGILLCEGKPAANVLVKLYDDDRRGTDTEDLMAEGQTDEDGHFKVEGYTQDFTNIGPKIYIYHDCNDHKPCQRKISIMVPDTFISSGQHPKEYYDAGTVELEGNFKDEERDCFS